MAIRPDQIARILVLNGLNWTQGEIAADVGVSESTVGKYVNMAEEESKADGADPEAIFLSYYVEGVGQAFAEMVRGQTLS